MYRPCRHSRLRFFGRCFVRRGGLRGQRPQNDKASARGLLNVDGRPRIADSSAAALLDSSPMFETKRDRDRRLDPRVSDNVVQAEYVVPSPQVRDLSVSGIYLADTRTFQIGQTVELRLRLGASEPMSIGGMVRRVDPGQGMAVEFIHLETADRRRIKEFIARAHPEKVSPADEDILA